MMAVASFNYVSLAIILLQAGRRFGLFGWS